MPSDRHDRLHASRALSAARPTPYHTPLRAEEIASRVDGAGVVQVDLACPSGSNRRQGRVAEASNIIRLPSIPNPVSRHQLPPWLNLARHASSRHIVHPPPLPSSPRVSHWQLPVSVHQHDWADSIDRVVAVATGAETSHKEGVARSSFPCQPSVHYQTSALQPPDVMESWSAQDVRTGELPLLFTAGAGPVVAGAAPAQVPTHIHDWSDAALGLDDAAFRPVEWVTPGFMVDTSHPPGLHSTPSTLASTLISTPMAPAAAPPAVLALPQWPLGTGPLPVPPPKKPRILRPKDRDRERDRDRDRQQMRQERRYGQRYQQTPESQHAQTDWEHIQCDQQLDYQRAQGLDQLRGPQQAPRVCQQVQSDWQPSRRDCQQDHRNHQPTGAASAWTLSSLNECADTRPEWEEPLEQAQAEVDGSWPHTGIG